MFAIIGKNDKVLFSMALKQNSDITSYQQFQIHSSIDLIEYKAKISSD